MALPRPDADSSAAWLEKAQAALDAQHYGQAERLLDETLADNDGDAAAYTLMAEVHKGRGNAAQMAHHLAKAVLAEPWDLARKKRLLREAGDTVFNAHDAALEAAVLLCLQTPDLEFAYATALWASTLRLKPRFETLLQDAIKPRWFSFGKNPLGRQQDLSALCDPYFYLGLRKIVLTWLPFELLVTPLRRLLLTDGARLFAPGDLRHLAAATALYAFHTDYILDVSPAEKAAAAALRSRLAQQDAAALDPTQLALLAAYEPLDSLPQAEALALRFRDDPDLGALVREQITEPCQLAARARAITAATPIDDATSLLVKGMYEVFPYPRWRELEETAFTWRAQDAACLSHPGATGLVAGCGTGRESCQLAAAFPAADILAVDITQASLAYAATKADYYGLGNIRYQQADILRLAELGRSFDYIHCVGVLHHMQDPEAGWAALANLLKPQGVMHIGLYGEVPRRSIVAARAAIAKGGYQGTAEDMRRFRKDSPRLLKPEHLATLLKARDYYYLNMYRDLLFHVHEDRFTLPRLQQALTRLGLVFEGFKLPPAVLADYRTRFPQDPGGLNLDLWERYEQAHPDTFIHSYKFWCRKAA